MKMLTETATLFLSLRMAGVVNSSERLDYRIDRCFAAAAYQKLLF